MSPGRGDGVPGDGGDDTANTQTKSVSWYVSTGHVTTSHRRVALLRRAGSEWVVQHIRGVYLRQQGRTTSRLEPDATVADIPPWVRSDVDGPFVEKSGQSGSSASDGEVFRRGGWVQRDRDPNDDSPATAGGGRS